MTLINFRLTPRVIPGPLHEFNQKASDWSQEGLLGYGCQSQLMVYDPRTCQIVASHDLHTAIINRVRWMSGRMFERLGELDKSTVVSSDMEGTIQIFNVPKNLPISTLSESNRKPIDCFDFLFEDHNSVPYILVLYCKSYFMLWDFPKAHKIWKTLINEPIIGFSINPLDNTRITAYSNTYLYLYNNVQSSVAFDASAAFKLRTYVADTSSDAKNSSHPSSKTEITKSIFNYPLRAMQEKLSSDKNSSNEAINSASSYDEGIKEAVYLKNLHHCLLITLSKELIIYDTESSQVLTSIHLENSVELSISLEQRDAIICYHKRGTISVIYGKKKLYRTGQSEVINTSSSTDVTEPEKNKFHFYTYHAEYSCQLALTFPIPSTIRNNSVYGILVDPISERELIIITSFGQILTMELYETVPTSNKNESESLIKYSIPDGLKFFKDLFLSDQPSGGNGKCDKDSTLGMRIRSFFECVRSNPRCMKSCPPLTSKNLPTYKPEFAVGYQDGKIQVFDASKGKLICLIQVHQSCVRQIEWLTSDVIISFAISPNDKSEICVTNLRSGHVRVLLQTRIVEESSLKYIKVSTLKMYFILIYAKYPAQIWSVDTLSFLQELPGLNNMIIAADWTSGGRVADNLEGSSKEELFDMQMDQYLQSHNENFKNYVENLICIDSKGFIKQYSLDGISVREVDNLQSDIAMGEILCCAWKSEFFLCGDADGNLCILNMKRKHSRIYPVKYGPISKIRFGPGKGNSKVLFLSGDTFHVWDVTESKVVPLNKYKNDSTIDADWIGSDLPALLNPSGMISLLELGNLSRRNILFKSELTEPLFLPQISNEENSYAIFQYLLSHGISNKSVPPFVSQYLNLIPSHIMELIKNEKRVDYKMVLISRLIRDKSEVAFWESVVQALDFDQKSSSLPSSSNSQTSFDDLYEISSSDQPTFGDSSCELLMLPKKFMALQLWRTYLREQLSKQAKDCSSHSFTKWFIYLNHPAKAIDLLIKTDFSDTNFYSDSLRACLTSFLMMEPIESISIAKFVARNIFAAGKIDESIEILCQIGLSYEACKYLLSSRRWDEAFWIAKCRLSHQEYRDFIHYWIKYRRNFDRPSQIHEDELSLLLLLTAGDFETVIQKLIEENQVLRVEMLYECCKDMDIFKNSVQSCNELEVKINSMTTKWLVDVGLMNKI